MLVIRYRIALLIMTIENGSNGDVMDKRKTKFNEFGCDKVHHITKEEIYRLMNSTEIYATKDIMDNFRMNGEVIKGIRL